MSIYSFNPSSFAYCNENTQLNSLFFPFWLIIIFKNYLVLMIKSLAHVHYYIMAEMQIKVTLFCQSVYIVFNYTIARRIMELFPQASWYRKRNPAHSDYNIKILGQNRTFIHFDCTQPLSIRTYIWWIKFGKLVSQN